MHRIVVKIAEIGADVGADLGLAIDSNRFWADGRNGTNHR